MTLPEVGNCKFKIYYENFISNSKSNQYKHNLSNQRLKRFSNRVYMRKTLNYYPAIEIQSQFALITKNIQ